MLIPLRQRPLSELLGALAAGRPDAGLDDIRQLVWQELGRRIAEGKE